MLLTTLVIVIVARRVPTMQRGDVVEGKGALLTGFSMASLRYMEDEDAVRLLGSVLGKHSSRRLDAARELAGDSGRHVLERVCLALRADHPVEVKRLLAFILARYGQREGFAWLVNSLAIRDMTWELLVEASQLNLDAGMGDTVNAVQWQDWLRSQSDADLEDRRLRSVYSIVSYVFDPVRDDYNYAISLLQGGGGRGECARRLLSVAALHPEHEYADAARELGDVLKTMASEDLAHRHAMPDPKAGEDDVFQSLVYGLRDLTNDGSIVVVNSRVSILRASTPGGGENPAQALVDLGENVIPRMVTLLSDRRATRTVKRSSFGMTAAHVLRYQDVAAEVLGVLMPWRVDVPLSPCTQFSEQPAHVRERALVRVRAWMRATKDQSGEERLWTSVAYASSMRDKLRMLRGLSVRDNTRPLRVLQRLYRERAAWRPEICELMCDLGDRTFLKDILAHGDERATYEGLPGGGGGRYLTACRTIEHLRARFAK